MYAWKKNPPKDIIPPVDIIFWASQVVQWVKNLPAIFGKIPWRRAWQLPPVFMLGEFCGQRSLVGYSPLNCKESDMTEVTEHRGIIF